MEMSKAYIRSARAGDPPEARSRDYVFAVSVKEAMHWDTRDSAEHARETYEMGQISFHLEDGRTHFCSGFEVEEVAPNDFVISIMAPFEGMKPMKKEP